VDNWRTASLSPTQPSLGFKRPLLNARGGTTQRPQYSRSLTKIRRGNQQLLHTIKSGCSLFDGEVQFCLLLASQVCKSEGEDIMIRFFGHV
jgi:hypothetical protein